MRTKYVKGRVWEILFCNSDGYLVEGSRSNIFLVVNGTLITPAIKQGPLRGITRQKVLQLAKNLHIPVQEKSLKPELLLQANEVFLSSSLRGILPVSRIVSLQANTAPGTITKRLQKQYTAAVRDALKNARA